MTKKTSILLLLTLQTTPLLCPPGQELAPLASEIGQKVTSLVHLDQKDMRTMALAAGAAGLTWFGLSAVKSLWNRKPEQQPHDRLGKLEADIAELKNRQELMDQLETDVQELQNYLPEKEAAKQQALSHILFTEITDLQAGVVTLQEQFPFWAKLYGVLRKRAQERGEQPVTAEEFADFVLDSRQEKQRQLAECSSATDEQEKSVDDEQDDQTTAEQPEIVQAEAAEEQSDVIKGEILEENA